MSESLPPDRAALQERFAHVPWLPSAEPLKETPIPMGNVEINPPYVRVPDQRPSGGTLPASVRFRFSLNPDGRFAEYDIPATLVRQG